MANPDFVECPADTWTILATNVTALEIVKKYVTDSASDVQLDQPINYLYTRKDTGFAAPTDKELSHILFLDADKELLEFPVSSDIYVYPIDNAGKVMVDIGGSLGMGSIVSESTIQAIATYTWILDAEAALYPHNFIGVEFFSDAIGTPATPSSGTYTIQVETTELPDVFQDPANNSVTASSPISVSFAGNPVSIKMTPNTIVGATHFRINLTSNMT